MKKIEGQMIGARSPARAGRNVYTEGEIGLG